MELDNVFIEQAEYIKPQNFIEWSSEHPNESIIIKKLTQSGAKLLSGPRGCGKTTLMLKAFNKLCRKGKNGAFPVYVNFKSSLRLEPIYRKQANGSFWFSQWMYLKLYEGIYESLKKFNVDTEARFNIKLDEVVKLISLLELGEIDRAETKLESISTYDLENEIDKAMSITGKTRCVLLLDDAAHAFSHEQQKDFFEFYRKIKARNISPKAAIYPGVTNFSPTFNLGHDAEEVNAWIDPESDTYLKFMLSMLERRLPSDVNERILKDEALVKIICYSAFGIPRNLLNMVRNVYQEDGENKYKIQFNKRHVLSQIKKSIQSTTTVFTSLEDKLPTYKSYISEGNKVYDGLIELIKAYNKDKAPNRKSAILAIRKELSSPLKKIMGFFQYAGLVSQKKPLSKGEKGVFDLYLINLAALVDTNALMASKASKTEDLATALESRNAHEYTRTNSNVLLDNIEEELQLSLPPCQSCGEPRTSDSARFCSSCGSPLQAASIFENIANQDISVLSLTKSRIAAIKENSSIRTVRDILHDIGYKELKSVPQIGTFWSDRIFSLAEEYIS
ncbi:hypothetical protein [Litorilituus sediminis]|uniref:Zinc ribbon domain-containing protein n=1 Tax=Litorilituus sediminis TaxID=718192 RepID=A0A4P6PAN3_9GAMM|nr:hypothetical protein [Litorilituus sediminis]QBG36705.1 hypothetical protein EMK97_13745 [Litorilituus sediminis]